MNAQSLEASLFTATNPSRFAHGIVPAQAQQLIIRSTVRFAMLSAPLSVGQAATPRSRRRPCLTLKEKV